MIFHAIGLMSGTSLDGLDICYASFEKNTIQNTWKYSIINAETIQYSKNWENKLRDSFKISAPDLMELHSEYGFYLGECVQNFISKNNLNKIDVIASHGHTVFHQPKLKYTLQIGDGRAIKILNQFPVVYDFRSQDVLMGGNGAPLVPIGDSLLFSDYDACINIGGFSNISFNKNGERIAFDICPVNIVLNKLAEQLGEKYDKDGEFAKQGKVDQEILKYLNNLEFYKKNPPKSLGVEWVNSEIFPILQSLEPKDAIATFTIHAAEEIAKTATENNLKNLFFTGGGSFNKYLLEQIKAKTSVEIIVPNEETINYKEALIFAFMGVLRINNTNNVLSSATGSSADHCSGLLI